MIPYIPFVRDTPTEEVLCLYTLTWCVKGIFIFIIFKVHLKGPNGNAFRITDGGNESMVRYLVGFLLFSLELLARWNRFPTSFRV